MKNMKKMSAVILAASMAMMSLTGCGGSGDAAETTGTPAATEAAKTEAEAETGAAEAENEETEAQAAATDRKSVV